MVEKQSGRFGYGDIVSVYEQSLSQISGETRAVVLATPNIGTQARADEAAQEIATEFAQPLDVKEIEMDGGERPTYLFDTLAVRDDFTGGFVGLVTGLESDFSEDGYIVRNYLNQRCPHFHFWGSWENMVEGLGVTWLSTIDSGVYRYSPYDGIWTAQNFGLSGAALTVREIATDPYDFETAWIATFDGIYRYEYGLWTKQTLPSPANDAGDSPAPTYSDLDFVSIDLPDTEVVVTTARHKSLNRGWVYTYNGTSWTSYQLSY